MAIFLVTLITNECESFVAFPRCIHLHTREALELYAILIVCVSTFTHGRPSGCTSFLLSVYPPSHTGGPRVVRHSYCLCIHLHTREALELYVILIVCVSTFTHGRPSSCTSFLLSVYPPSHTGGPRVVRHSYCLCIHLHTREAVELYVILIVCVSTFTHGRPSSCTSFLLSVCRLCWRRCFERRQALVKHAMQVHFDHSCSTIVCQWQGCDILGRQKWSFVQHLQVQVIDKAQCCKLCPLNSSQVRLYCCSTTLDVPRRIL